MTDTPSSSAQLRLLIDATSEPCALISADGTFLQVNEAMARASGATVDGLIGTNAYDHFTEEEAAHHKQLNDQTMRSGEPAHYEIEKQGLVYAVSTYPLGEEMFALYGRDITEQRRLEGQTQKSAEMFRAVTETAEDAIFIKDLDRRYTLVNPAMAKLLGLPADQIIGKRADDIFDAEALAAIEQADGPAFLGEVNTGTWTVNVAERRHTFHVVEVPLRNDGGEVWSICGIVRDITVLKETEETLREKVFLVESASSIISTADLEGKITYANPAFLCTWGYNSLDEVRGDHFSDHWLVSEIREEVMEALLGEGTWFGEVKARRKDGAIFDVQVSAAAIKDGEGNVIGLMSSSIDITERKQAERALARRAEELARSNQELEHFAYVASHDLQEPLRIMASFSEVLQRRYGEQLDEKGVRYLNHIVEGATRMQALIRGLLTISRVGTHGKPLTKVASHAVLEEVLKDLQRVIASAGATITAEDLPQVLADRVQLSRLLRNLIGNALKFRGQAAPTVTISSQKIGHLIRFDIQDNGIGIDEKFHDRIFKMFQRLHTRETYEGNGIGLAVARKIVERHGGTIWLDSTPGSGTRFSFTLPSA